MTHTIANIRKENLRQLIDDFPIAPGNRAAWCRHYGLDPLQIGHYFTKSKNARKMGERKAREIEALCGKKPGWMDLDAESQFLIKEDTAEYKIEQNIESANLSLEASQLINTIMALDKSGAHPKTFSVVKELLIQIKREK